jgi:hypothetical protein
MNTTQRKFLTERIQGKVNIKIESQYEDEIPIRFLIIFSKAILIII